MMAAQEMERSGSADPDLLDADALPPLDLLPELESTDLPDEIADIVDIDEDDSEVDPEVDPNPGASAGRPPRTPRPR